MKVLVTIVSYGNGNDAYQDRMIKEFRSMPYDVDIVMLSNIAKEVPAGIELVVGLPTSDPWSLPFAHKRVLAERVDGYDLFIYTENDILITEKNIAGFLQATTYLQEDEIAGFLRTEVGPDGCKYYPDVNKMYHWDPQSVVQRGEQVFAFFTNEHAGCFVLTSQQLRRAIDSGGFLVEPHRGQYNLAEAAATDPYTQCGFKKMICISDLETFLVPHLSNKYLGTEFDLGYRDFDRQIEALIEIHRGKRSQERLMNTETSLPKLKLSKSYYEPRRPEILELIPLGVERVLSIGCGWGMMEESLVQKAIRVTAIPLDSVISACAESRGVKAISPDFEAAWKELADLRFDHILISNVLHLVPDPPAILMECARHLSDGGSITLIVPNFNYSKVLWRRILSEPGYTNLGNFDEAGVNVTTHRLIRKWFKTCGFVMDRVIEVVPKRAEVISRLLSVAGPYLTPELVVMGHKKATKAHETTGNHSSNSQRRTEKQLTVTA